MELWLGQCWRGDLPTVSDCCSFVVSALLTFDLSMASLLVLCHKVGCSYEVCGGLLGDLTQQGGIEFLEREKIETRRSVEKLQFGRRVCMF